MSRVARSRRTGRRPGESGTREAILRAARGRFNDHGYAGATIRDIAADAGVAPALVHHFFGTKEALFADAMRLPVLPSEVMAQVIGSGLGDSAGSMGEAMVRAALMMWEVPDIREPFIGLLRSAVIDERALRMFREFLTEVIINVIATAVEQGGRSPAAEADARFRASLVASQMLGLGLGRYLLKIESLADAGADDLVRAIGPAIDLYLTGSLSRTGGE